MFDDFRFQTKRIFEMSKESRIKEDVLPVELIHRIQSLLPLKEAATTRSLSKSWLHAWHTIPTLRVICPERVQLSSYHAKKYTKLIHTTMQRYHRDNMPIESFHLRLNIREDYLNPKDVENWIRVAVSKSCLKELSLDIVVKDSFTLPNELFSSQNLHTINVATGYRVFNIPIRICTNSPVINCVSLRVLDLKYVVITENMFHNVLSTCTSLEKIKLLRCEGLKNVKVKNLLHLSELDIFLREPDDLLEFNNIPSLVSFHYRSSKYDSALAYLRKKSIPFQIDSLASVTQLCIESVSIDDSFFKTIQSKFSVLESLTLGINYWKFENMVISSFSLKWLTLGINLFLSHQVSVQVDAPRLVSFIYTGGNIPGLVFPTTLPEQIKLTFESCNDWGHSYFLKMREALNFSSKFDINIRRFNLDSVAGGLNIDVDDLRRRVLLPVGNVQLTLETGLDEHVWKQSRFFEALFLICHPSYIRSSYQVIRKMMEGNTTDLKEVLLKNPHDGKWEALTSSWISVLHTFPGHLFECKLNWFPQ
ncbi:F-box protein-like protein [Tanacetum coccineum]